MGGDCEAGTEGWEIGVYGNEITEEGKRWWGDDSGKGRDDRVVSYDLSFRTIADHSVCTADGTPNQRFGIRYR